MKKILSLIVIFLAFYLGAHFYLKEKNAQPVAVPRLVACEGNNVRAIRIDTMSENQPVRLEFRRTDKPAPGVPAAAQLEFSDWAFEKPFQIEADASALTRIATLFCDLYHPDVPSEEQLGESMGLAKAVEVTVGDATGEKTYRVTFGKISSDQMNETVAFEDASGAKSLTRISPKLLQLSSLKPTDFKNLHVMHMPVDMVQMAALLNPGGRERFTLERNGTDWNVSSGGKPMGMGNGEAVKFVNRLGTLRALNAEVRAAGPCPKDPRKLTLQFHGLNNHEEEISFDYGKTGNLRVCNDARPETFEVSRDLLPYLDVNPEKLLLKK